MSREWGGAARLRGAGWWWGRGILLLVGAAALLAACGSLGTPGAGSPGPARSTATPTRPTAPALSTIGILDFAATATMIAFQEFKGGYPKGAFADPTNAAAATAAVEQYARYQTATALTPTAIPIPTFTPAPTTPPPPTPTWFVGRLTDTGCIRRPYPTWPELGSCWHIQVHSDWFLVAAGYDGTLGVDAASVIMVCREPCHLMTAEEQFYRPPINEADVHIIAASGPLVTVAARDPTFNHLFVFDLTIRQWTIATPRATPAPTRPTAPTLSATDIPDFAVTATTVAFQEFKAGAPPGWFANPIHAAAATEAVTRASQYETATALTPHATQPAWTPAPEPTAPLRAGRITDMNCWAAVHPGGAQFDSCWETSAGDRWIRVGVGYSGDSFDYSLQGLLWVCPEPCVFPSADQLHAAPRADLHIIAVNGALVTVASRDPAIHDTFVFDITTHQWITSTPGATPSP